ncbi:phospholipase D-like domain-containing protein [Chitinophaga ginsengisegetis]|uniref:phospholipase D-like domain-containing protein n=1 Tax=Chitinophaga ginsengisegetis TaxID=393003 RepID=UPI00373FC991
MAFLKRSGLDLILDRLSENCTFYVGTDYYLTEPLAIKKLLRNGSKVYLTKKVKSTFHPKIYYFRQGNNISILAGSANITGGGLDTNFEVSVLIQIEKNSSVDKEFKAMIETYSSNSTQITGDIQLSQYEREFDTYRKKHRKADKEFKDEIENTHKLDLSQLDRFVKEYVADSGLERFAERIEYYKTAKRLMNSITKNNITSPNDFLYYYEDIAKSFHSSGLLRGKKTLAKKYKTIISIIRIIQENKSADPVLVFSKTLPLMHSVKGFGGNALTEIMNTYNPNKYSIANGRTLKSLSKLGFAEYPTANNFSVDTYEDYNTLITEIAIACKFKDLGLVDHFLSWYYENYAKE